MNEKEQLMKKLQEVGFALVELNLYLDSHPDCAEALSDHARLSADYTALCREYGQNYGPLTAAGAKNDDYWDWTATPWPWENGK